MVCLVFYSVFEVFKSSKVVILQLLCNLGTPTLECGIDVGQGITIGPGKFIKKNKRRPLNKRRA